MSLSLQQIKLIKSLHTKKYREKKSNFLVEGEKCVLELLQSNFKVKHVTCTDSFFKQHAALLHDKNIKIFVENKNILQKISTLQTNEQVLAVAYTKPRKKIETLKKNYYVVLDAVRDPGNFGTILRIADWYNMHIIATNDCVDFYNPKVIKASMGSFANVEVFHDNIENIINNYKNASVYGAFLEGKDIHNQKIPKPSLIIFGNEAQGIRKSLQKRIGENKITIPKYGKAESLNVALAVAVVCDNLRRNEKV